MGNTEQGVRKTKEAWFRRVAGLFDRRWQDPELWEELEELLIAADVGVATTAKLLDAVRARAREFKGAEQARQALQEEMMALLAGPGAGPGPAPGPARKPLVMLVVGVNGTGKTTSIAKLAHSFKGEGQRVILAAADTFRAAAIDQLRIWGERVGVEIIAHQPGADPGAVVFDALQAARGRGADMVIIDTAGRLHTKFNLMEELKKVRRVIDKADAGLALEVLLVLDATTGQNGLSQARYFAQAVGITGVFLAKLDGTAKGGIVLAICDQLHLPIRFLGTGEGLEDMVPFQPREFVEALFSKD